MYSQWPATPDGTTTSWVGCYYIQKLILFKTGYLTRTICVQYLRILLSCFEEDFKGLINRNHIFAFFHIQSSAKKYVGPR